MPENRDCCRNYCLRVEATAQLLPVGRIFRDGSKILAVGNAAGDEDFFDHSFADDFVELVFHLAAEGFQAGFGAAAQFFGIALGDDGAGAVADGGFAGLEFEHLELDDFSFFAFDWAAVGAGFTVAALAVAAFFIAGGVGGGGGVGW